MTNTEGFVTLTPAALQRTCYSSEQDRLNEYAKSLRVPIQTGEIIKGDKGDKGEKGERGLTGPKGPKGDDGKSLSRVSEDVVVLPGQNKADIPGDVRSHTINLYYTNTIDPPSLMGIMCLRYDGLNNKTIVYFNVVAPDAMFRLRVTTFV